MFVRKKKNKSGSISVQIIDKSQGGYKVVTTIGSSKDKNEINSFIRKAYGKIDDILFQETLPLQTSKDKEILDYLKKESALKVRVSGPEDILGFIFDKIGFKQIEDKLFRYLVITRLIHPASKLKTVDYLERYNNIQIDINRLYRFLDKISDKYKTELEDIIFTRTKKILKGKIAVVFYDITTLYFESTSEDDLRRTGFSKDGKAQNPQILLGLLVGQNGYPLAYDIYEGNTYEGKTFIPILLKYVKRFSINKPIIVADSGILSNENITQLEEQGYEYIIGARLKNESQNNKGKILSRKLGSDGEASEFKKENRRRLIVSYSRRRAKKDMHNRKRGLRRLQKLITSGKLTKQQINNRGYNKYLKLSGQMEVKIDCEKYKEDARWDGLKGYITNTKLTAANVIENYNQLWQIEKAFRISKTDLRVRPVYHRVRKRIEAHISIAFAAYAVFKELERLLKQYNTGLSAQRAIELLKTIYTLEVTLPDSRITENIKINLSDEQKLIYKICRIYEKNSRVSR